MVYLDHHVITRPSLSVLEQMFSLYREKWRMDSYTSLKSLPTHHHFILTQGRSEAIFQFLLSFYLDEIRESGKNHLLTCMNEEASILLSLNKLEEFGCFTKTLPLDGPLSLDVLEQALQPKTSLLSISWANALTGVIQPIEEIVKICHARGVKVHVNASHVIGKLPITFDAIDFLTMDGDKIHTPQGIGLLLQIKKPSEKNTNPIPLASLDLALNEALSRQQQFILETVRLRNSFESELKYMIPDCEILFQEAERLPHISAISFPGVMGEALLYLLERKQVFATIGGGEHQRLPETAISFALSHETTEDELAIALDAIVSSVRQLKNLSNAL